MDPTRAFGHGHPLHPLHPALELQTAEGSLAFDQADDLLEAAETGRIRAHDLDFPSPPLRIARIHPEEIGGEETRLVAARARANLEQDAALVACVLRQQQSLEVGLERLQSLAQRSELGAAGPAPVRLAA